MSAMNFMQSCYGEVRVRDVATKVMLASPITPETTRACGFESRHEVSAESLRSLSADRLCDIVHKRTACQVESRARHATRLAESSIRRIKVSAMQCRLMW